MDIQLKEGDCLVLYTDGLTEAMDKERKMFEKNRLRHLVERVGGLETADAIMDRIYDGVKDFTNGATQHDDTTVVVYKLTN